ncbi:MAG: hypothetical protein OXF43_01540 [Gammaproteobacteria bacterium]|nr:hypothetical protein [Gammaproteobacteria bacterium]MCY4181557.1 hypothetical protein [Gammaproteobacteria bacterium]
MQILLEQEQYRLLGIEARRKGISMSALVRTLVDTHFRSRNEHREDPLESIIGIGSGTGEAVGRDHNRHLYGSPD